MVCGLNAVLSAPLSGKRQLAVRESSSPITISSGDSGARGTVAPNKDVANAIAIAIPHLMTGIRANMTPPHCAERNDLRNNRSQLALAAGGRLGGPAMRGVDELPYFANLPFPVYTP